jgi:hypothetical protein
MNSSLLNDLFFYARKNDSKMSNVCGWVRRRTAVAFLEGNKRNLRNWPKEGGYMQRSQTGTLLGHEF